MAKARGDVLVISREIRSGREPILLEELEDLEISGGNGNIALSVPTFHLVTSGHDRGGRSVPFPPRKDELDRFGTTNHSRKGMAAP